MSMEKSHLRDTVGIPSRRNHPDLEGLSAEEIRNFVHELSIHQVEMEERNEELRQTCLALQESIDHYRDLYDLAPIGYFTLNGNGEILEANYTGCTLLGVKRRSLIGRFFSEYLTQEGGDEFILHLGRVLEKGENESVDLPMASLAGRYLRLESVAAKNSDGGNLCRTAVTDITERKQAEKRHRDARVAEEARRAKNEFLANMSHEIRTPMTIFIAAIENLLRVDFEPERRNLLLMADQSAMHLEALVNDILDFSQIEARELDLVEEMFDLRTLVDEAMNMFALQAKKKHLRLEYDLDPQIPERIVGDPSRLRQILINLVGNAVKFTHEGEIRI